MRSSGREDAGPTPLGRAPDRSTTPLPGTFGLGLDPASSALDNGRVLMGGSPLRLLHVTSRASGIVKKWEAGSVVGDRRNEQLLARRLVSSGVYLPRPGVSGFASTDVTVVIPVRERAEQLLRLLSVLKGLPCVVVDDASSEPSRTQDIAREFGADLVVLTTNSGPSVARNAGLAKVGTRLVAFVDSDCVPDDGWLEPLLGYFDDPMVVAVAPRIVPNPPTTGGSWARYEAAHSSLDLGSKPGLVRPNSRIPWVPSATLVVRRGAVPDDLFDPRLRGGEDVDLVWRLVGAGWDVRYEPRSTVRHDGPRSLQGWLGRRAFYGTTAGPLARRHPGLLSPLQTSAWTAGVWALVAARKPLLAAAALGTSVAVLARRLDGVVDQPLKVAGRIAGGGTLTSALPAVNGLSRAWSPAFLLALGRRRTRRVATVALLLPALGDWMRERGELDPLRYTTLHVADDLAYGVGVWRGCLTAHTVAPLVPRLAFRSRVWSNRGVRAGGEADRS